MVNEIFYVTGRRGSLDSGLAEFLRERARTISGISLSNDFLAMPFDHQLSQIATHFERIERQCIPMIANSYGAYLLLNCLIGKPALKTHVLLLSPVLGTVVTTAGYFKPPHSRRIHDALVHGTLPKPFYLYICVGSLDDQCDTKMARTVSHNIQADNFHVVDGQGHMLEKTTVRSIVDEFLVNAALTLPDT
jgi:hypothetical protein